MAFAGVFSLVPAVATQRPRQELHASPLQRKLNEFLAQKVCRELKVLKPPGG